VQRDTNTDTPLPPDEPAGANPPDGAIIDYYLAHHASAPVTIEILDARGQIIRRFSSADQASVTDSDLKKQLIPLYWLRPFRSLSSEAGMHRWIWDLRYAAPDSARHEYPIAAIPGDTPRYPLGPTALPGSYSARLTANRKTYTAPFSVKMDPRVHISEAGLEKKFQLEIRLASLLSETSKAVMQAGSIGEPLQKLSQQTSGPSQDAVRALQNKLAAVLGAPAGFAAPPADAVTLTRVNGQVTTLYGQVWQADSEPTPAQSEAGAAIEHDASEAMRRWDAIKTSDLPALNRALRGAKLPEVRIESESRKDETGMDEE
jgi:hypothetical protein